MFGWGLCPLLSNYSASNGRIGKPILEIPSDMRAGMRSDYTFQASLEAYSDSIYTHSPPNQRLKNSKLASG